MVTIVVIIKPIVVGSMALRNRSRSSIIDTACCIPAVGADGMAVEYKGWHCPSSHADCQSGLFSPFLTLGFLK